MVLEICRENINYIQVSKTLQVHDHCTNISCFLQKVVFPIKNKSVSTLQDYNESAVQYLVIIRKYYSATHDPGL